MSNTKKERLVRRRVGEIPLLLIVASRLGFKETLERFIRSHGNNRVPTADTLMMLVCNVVSGRQPLYELKDWALGLDSRIFDCEEFEEGLFNDDRFGRALDRLYSVDYATMMTEIVLKTVKVVNLDLSQLHNDSTTVKACGKIPGRTKNGLYLSRGHSKDHRPDLKQLVYSLSISSDGAVPIHFKSYPGNRTDDTTHIETWETLQTIAGKQDFLYVADCKVCTDGQLHYIVGRGGRVITIVPETWNETKEFKKTLRKKKIGKQVITKRKVPNSRDEKVETFSCFNGTYVTEKRGYKIHWIYSTEKKKRDRQARETFLRKVENELTEISAKLNVRKLKTKEQIQKKIDGILEKRHVKQMYHMEILEVREQETRQIGRGRPGNDTEYTTTFNTIYSLSWTRSKTALKEEQGLDGIFPILTTDKDVKAKEALIAYKYQPRLEKRFSQFKSIHQAAPLLFKKIERVDAMMFVFFMALILQAVIEREVRRSMKDSKIEGISIYPEHRLAYHPTTAVIFDRFSDISTYQILKGNSTIKEYRDDLNPIQQEVLSLLQISETEFWKFAA